MSNKFNVGDMVIMTRQPTYEEWQEIGEATIPQQYYEQSHQVVRVLERPAAIQLTLNDYVYPSSCFELASDIAAEQYKKDVQKQALLKHAKQNYHPGTRFINRMGSITTVANDPQYVYSSNDKGVYLKSIHGTLVYVYYEGKWAEIVSANNVQAKQGDYIKILHHNGYSGIKGETFYVVNVTDNQNFELAKPGTGDTATIRWACSNPGYYEICDTVQVVNEYKAKEYAKGIIDCELPTFDSKSIDLALSELQKDYFKQIKNQHNGTENTESVKLQRVNLKIREGNPIRRIGLKSSGSKIKLGSNYSYN
jgi:hypothetical protein